MTPLVNPSDLLEAPGSYRIADVRWYLGEPGKGYAAYREGHIPGAAYADLERDLSSYPGPGRHPLPTREAFAAAIGALGFGDEDFVVAYDDRGGAVASRLWWMLRDIGHERVAVLDGGVQGWLAAGGDVTSGVEELSPATMSVRPSLTRSIDRDQLADRLGEVTVVDARDFTRYTGESEPVDPVAGHIPGALSIPLSGNLDDAGRFLDAEALRARYPDSGDVVVYCGSGVTACHDVLAMTLAGLPEPILYPGSWSDWSTAGMPVAIGPEP